MAITLKAIEATVTPDGRIQTADPLPFTRPTKVILTVAVEQGEDELLNLAVASEAAWSKDWNRDEEDEAWASLQDEKSS